MAEVTAGMVKELREKTDAPMMECKKALAEADGNMARAEEILRVKLGSKAAKVSSRVAAEGIVAIDVEASGKTGSIVEVNCETDFVARTEDFQQLGKYLAEHIAAADPIAIDKESIPQEKIDSERRIFTEQVKAEGKPDHLIDKIVEGKVEAFYKDVALLHQAWVRDTAKTVGDLVKEVSAKTGENVKVRRFVRYQLGV